MKKSWNKEETFEQRFMKYVRVDHKSECWLWGGNIDFYGYGRVGYKMKTYRASRASFIIFHKTDPKKLFVCHKCDNPSCVNPDHLFLGTQKENMHDCQRKKRTASGSRNGMAKLSESDVLEIISLSKTGLFHRQIAEKFQVSRSAVGAIINNVRWTKLLPDNNGPRR